MSDSFVIPDSDLTTLQDFIDKLTQKGFDVSVIWKKNKKVANHPSDANIAQIFLEERLIFNFNHKVGLFYDTLLNYEEKRKVTQSLVEMHWIKNCDYSAALFCCLLHIFLIGVFLAIKKDGPGGQVAIGLGTSSLTIMCFGYILWLPKVKRAVVPGKFVFGIVLFGAFLTVPSSLLQLVLIKALQRKTLYNLAIKLNPASELL